MNLEEPVHSAKQHILFLTFDPNQREFRLPAHLRYHSPGFQSYQLITAFSSPLIWLKNKENDYELIEIDCPPLLLSIPIGDQRHTLLITMITLLATIGATLLIIFFIYKVHVISYLHFHQLKTKK